MALAQRRGEDGELGHLLLVGRLGRDSLPSYSNLPPSSPQSANFNIKAPPPQPPIRTIRSEQFQHNFFERTPAKAYNIKMGISPALGFVGHLCFPDFSSSRFLLLVSVSPVPGCAGLVVPVGSTIVHWVGSNSGYVVPVCAG